MAVLDPDQEPSDGSFEHAVSRRRYEIRRKDGRLWHRELLLTDGPAEVLLAEFPIKYVVGSGNHARMYVVEVDGFLVESPVTWYTSRKSWGMSAGFDKPDQVGFARPISEGCFYCHGGRAQNEGLSLHRMRILEPAISCERCHGPGALHLARHQGPPPVAEQRAGEIDYTIVNPAHLKRDLAEAICQQCHLRTGASVVSRGMQLTDYRPGLPLQDFRQEYALEAPNKSMMLIGHVAQMHQSRCYQANETFSCSTCHDPHGKPSAKKREGHYNAVCVACHQPERCRVDAARRQAESPENNCIQCHMPRAATEVRHLAMTHHRVGIHQKKADAPEEPARRLPGEGMLRPLLDLARLSDIDRQRSLGLGYLDQAHATEDRRQMLDFRRTALTLLSEVRAAGLRDGIVDASLARLYNDLGLDGALQYAQAALSYPDLGGQDRCVVLYLSAVAQLKEGKASAAASALRELVQWRRNAADWLLLADCEKALGNEGAVIEALTAATRINPRLWELHHFLADHFQRHGDQDRAAWHRQRSVR